MRRAIAVLFLVLALAGCGLFVRGRASEHGPNNIKVGVPF